MHFEHTLVTCFLEYLFHRLASMCHVQVILPDYLPGNPYSLLNQPTWCSYANGARSAVLVTEGGNVFYQQGWLNTDNLATAIDAYWTQDGKGTWDDIVVDASPKSQSKKPNQQKENKAKIGTSRLQERGEKKSGSP